MGPFSNTAGAFAFWMFIAIVVVASSARSAFRHYETQKTIRRSLDQGQPIDPALMAPESASYPASQLAAGPERLIMTGLVVIAVGIGLGVLGFFIGLDEGRPVYPLFGVGGLVFLIGVALETFGIWSFRRASRMRDAR